ncbi:putative pseudouridine synthase 3 protein [Phaeoacremonium minimum UCRPA7]|uniref:Putative pseudouridine synthase 3 protein n=1 Tax=Phaeoacremonium minimum (strain UCR-PA7) TaxID=1286976 RepID=R8BW34_PHAM7|nr:putative pseudouridine synthase 3 protein [Phaeoacremonium minimum UCRPA7]EOO03552.1 putative pseudouridine synthase 3 protein [Phaeoacremonium minimum UCRPA7]
MSSSQAKGRDFNKWTKESLVEHILRLENELKNRPAETEKPAEGAAAESEGPLPKRQKRELDLSRYCTRLIALKFAYLGKNYSGFEFTSGGKTPSIEEEIWKALLTARLIAPERPEEVNFSPFEYSKCGRTDRGVSAFGQVIGIRVRSSKLRRVQASQASLEGQEGEADAAGEASVDPQADEDDTPLPVEEEMEYCKVLNRLLPPDIRIYAWCPVPPPDFSARFSCRERQYRYFFTLPAFAPVPSSMDDQNSRNLVKPGWLDIEAMREAAKLYEGLHDFRNFCKVDPSKQITNFVRRIYEADIVEVKDIDSSIPFLSDSQFRPASLAEGTFPKVYYFHVRGSAFLWHQIRHMVSILFLVGQGLESPSVVSDLLDVERYPRKPNYVLADDQPLVLWDCIFGREGEEGDDDTLDWVYVGQDDAVNLHGFRGLIDNLWETWRERKMDEILANRLLDWVFTKADPRRTAVSKRKPTTSVKVFEGANSVKPLGKYVPLSQKHFLPTPEETNDKYAQRKGFANSEEMRARGNWRSELRAAKKGAPVSVDDDADE